VRKGKHDVAALCHAAARVNGGLERDDVCALVAAGNEVLRFIQCVFVDADDAAGLYDE
jgi:hypothetical protein